MHLADGCIGHHAVVQQPLFVLSIWRAAALVVHLLVPFFCVKRVAQRHTSNEQDLRGLGNCIPGDAVDPCLRLGRRILQRLARLLRKVGARAVQAVEALNKATTCTLSHTHKS